MDKKISNNRCYYCLKEFKSGKSAIGDHVIPDALGGKLSFSNVCPECNTQLNNSIDRHLVRFNSIRASMYGIRPRKNREGKSSIKFDEFYVEGMDNNFKADLMSNGVRLREDVIVSKEYGKIFIAPNKEILEEKFKSKKVLPFDGYFVPDNKVGIGVTSCKVDAEIMLRALLKICINFIGAQKNIEYLENLKLEELKNFIITGENSSGKFKRIQLFEDDKKFRKHNHHGIRINKQDNMLVGLVLIFNVLEKVVLSDEFNEEFQKIYYYEKYY